MERNNLRGGTKNKVFRCSSCDLLLNYSILSHGFKLYIVDVITSFLELQTMHYFGNTLHYNTKLSRLYNGCTRERSCIIGQNTKGSPLDQSA